MDIKELEQDYIDDLKARDQAQDQVNEAVSWLNKMNFNLERSKRAYDKAKVEEMTLEARRLTVHND